MEINTVYKFTKSFKVEATSRKFELRDKYFKYVDETSSFYIVKVCGHKVALLLDKNSIDSKIKSGSIVVSNEVSFNEEKVNTTNRTTLNSDILAEIGYTKTADIYTNGTNSLYLIKGHTWHLTDSTSKYGKDVNYLDELP